MTGFAFPLLPPNRRQASFPKRIQAGGMAGKLLAVLAMKGGPRGE
jgi:hypothetical protein